MPQQTGRWHHLYNTRRWQRRAKLQLTEFPLCAMCLAREVVTPATVADHVVPHKGDHQLFYLGIYSPSARFVTATARSSRRHTATNGTSGLTVGLPTRTIPRISLALKGLANQGMVLEHVDGCLWGARHPPVDLKSMRSHGRGGLRKN